MIGLTQGIRQALPSDQNRIANLIYFESYVHRHLDWRMPLEWLGVPEFWVNELGGSIVAAFACPPDPEDIYWLRLFARSTAIPLDETWERLWQTALSTLPALTGQVAAAIVLNDWFKDLLATSGFEERQQIVVLEHSVTSFEERQLETGIYLRSMTREDLPEVARVDAAAFSPLWQNSLLSLQHAFTQAGVATVAVYKNQLVGYQISTRNPFGAHLARLAVLPDFQGHNIGYGLVQDLLQALQRAADYRLTVNTQSDNTASLSLYNNIGFDPTGEKYPVYVYQF